MTPQVKTYSLPVVILEFKDDGGVRSFLFATTISDTKFFTCWNRWLRRQH